MRCELIRQVVTEFGSSGLGLTPAAEQTGAESAQLCVQLSCDRSQILGTTLSTLVSIPAESMRFEI